MNLLRLWFRVVILPEGLAGPTLPLAYRAGAAPSQRNSRAAVFRREDDEACDHCRTIRATHQRLPLLACGVGEDVLAAATASITSGRPGRGEDIQPLASRYGRLQCASSEASVAADTLGGRPGAAVGGTGTSWQRYSVGGQRCPWSRSVWG
jgi:hypothetical protein